MKRVSIGFWSLWLIFPLIGYGYELGTHARITQQAYNRSMMGNGDELINQLGLYRKGIYGGAEASAGMYHFDVIESAIEQRFAYEWEADRMPVLGSKRSEHLQNSLTIEGWLMRGAIREDDSYGESNPQDDPFNRDLRRVLHHFFDPVFNRPLDKFGLSYLDSDVHKAPDWGIGTRDAFSQPNTPEANRRNHFTVFDAQEAMYRALTGKKKNGTDAGRNNNKATESDRKAYWATTFRALGDVVHLIQDMAQPQHTRNDAHAGKSPQFLTGHNGFSAWICGGCAEHTILQHLSCRRALL